MEYTLNWTVYLYIFVVGASLGSFLNCLVYRLPLNLSLTNPGSFCPCCSSRIRWRHNIPIFGWLILQGRCADCAEKISARYPLVELFFASLFTALLHQYGITLLFLGYGLLSFVLVAIFFIDYDHYRIPNALTYPMLPLGLLFSWYVRTDITDGIEGALFGGGIFLFLVLATKGKGMGLGDVKMIAMLGAWFGLIGCFYTILLSSLLGTIVGLALMLKEKVGMKTALPFGTFLSVASILLLFFGSEIRTIVGF